MKSECSIKSCTNPSRSKGMCKICYERDYRNKNRLKVRARNRKYAEKNREKVLQDKRDYYMQNREDCQRSKKKWYENNKAKKLAYEKQYILENREKRRKYVNGYVSKRVREDPLYKLKRDIRRLINVSIKNGGFTKNSRTHSLLGIGYEQLMDHLLYTFMERYGRKPKSTDNIHIDHIVPCSTANTQKELEKLQHYTNLQWLLAEDNFRKSDRLDWDE